MARHDQLAAAWERLEQVGRAGPFDERTCRLLELAVAIGSHDREAVRRAHDRVAQLAVFPEELEQLVALAASTLGKYATITTAGWLGLDASRPVPPSSKPDA